MAINTNYASLFTNSSYGSSAYGSNSFGGITSIKNNSFLSNYGKNNAVGMDSGTAQYLTGLKNSSSVLKSDLDSLIGKNGKKSVFSAKSAVSSDAESVSVKTDTDKMKDFKETTIDVEQVATAQTNKGGDLKSSDKDLLSGNYKFEVEVGGKKQQIAFSVASGDTNRTIQNKMADAINKSNIGVNASVSVDAANGKTTLAVKSNNTGVDAKNNFSIKDITGNAVEKMGIDSITTKAQNAIYSVNGQASKTSKTNAIDIGNGVTATLLKPTDKDVKLSVGNDSKQGIESVRQFMKDYNNIASNVANNSSDEGARKLYKQMSNLVTSYKSSLERVGINIDKTGKLVENKTKLEETSANGKLEQFFTSDKGSNYGFANRVSKLSTDISENTQDYVSKSALRSSSKDINFSPNQASRYNSLMNSGMLFDMYL